MHDSKDKSTDGIRLGTAMILGILQRKIRLEIYKVVARPFGQVPIQYCQ